MRTQTFSSNKPTRYILDHATSLTIDNDHFIQIVLPNHEGILHLSTRYSVHKQHWGMPIFDRLTKRTIVAVTYSLCVALLNVTPWLKPQVGQQTENIKKIFHRRHPLSRYLGKTIQINKNFHEKFCKKIHSCIKLTRTT